ncbi:MAG: helicase-exonuclease AddAB subunit AddA [Clostridia bacterium]
MRNWTAEQKTAIEQRGNLIVSAAAGAGKTAVLTERIARIVANGGSISRLLVVTFTNAAANEMKKRIEMRIALLADSVENNSEKERLLFESQNVLRASISTLHAFCSRVLRRHYSEIGLDPAFRIGDETESAILRDEAMDLVLDVLYDEDRENLEILAKTFSSEDALIEAVFAVYNIMLSRPDPFSWLEKAVDSYNLDSDALKASSAASLLLDAYKGITNDAIAEYSFARSFAEDSKACAALDLDISQLRALSMTNKYDQFIELLSSLSFSRMTFSRGIDPDLKEHVQSVRDVAKKNMQDLKKRCGRTLSQEIDLNKSVFPMLLTFKTVLERFHNVYMDKKRENAMLDFSDMEHFTLKLFENPNIVNEYRESFDCVFVDEYQDSNMVQERIVTSVAKKGGLFLVGDVKQSIYRFRLAEPRLFLEKLNSPDIARVDLSANFRSSRAVVSLVNELFSKIMNREATEIEYDNRARLKGTREANGKTELLLFAREVSDLENENSGYNEAEENEETDSRITEYAEAEAELAARRILNIIENDEYFDESKNETRKYRFSDFCILMRSIKGRADDFSRILMRYGIPTYAERSASFFDSVEVQIFMNLLRVIDNKLQDIPLLSVLRSYFYNFDTSELVQLRLKNHAESVEKSLAAAAKKDDPLGVRAKRVLDDLARYKKEATLLSVKDFMTFLLEETGYLEYISAGIGGSARVANIYELINKAETIENNGVRSLFGFLKYSDKANLTGTVSEVAECPINVVRIMSIHKSKGLEFPITIVAGLGSRFVSRENKAPNILRDTELGIGFSPVIGNVRLKTFFNNAIYEKQRRENFAEEIRTLYVALTRASERLILIGSMKNPALRAEQLFNAPETSRAVTRCKSHLELILFALLKSPAGVQLNEVFGLPIRNIDNEVPPVYVTNLDNMGYSSLAFDALPKIKFSEWAKEAEKSDTSIYDAAFSWEYPNFNDTFLPSKTTVTGTLKRDSVILSDPSFIEPESGINALKYGNAMHRLLELIILAPHDENGVKSELNRLVEAGLLSFDESALIDVKGISAFLRSELGTRLLKSSYVRREVPFNYKIRASEIFETDSESYTLLQGVIDCCFTENDEFVIIDYKTDSVDKNVGVFEAASAHKKQLALYSRALSDLTGKRVKECFVYMLTLRKAVRVI